MADQSPPPAGCGSDLEERAAWLEKRADAMRSANMFEKAEAAELWAMDAAALLRLACKKIDELERLAKLDTQKINELKGELEKLEAWTFNA